MYQGSATVGSLSVVASTVQVGSSSGATLKVTGDATVSSGGLSVLAGSTLTVTKTLALGTGVTGDATLTVSGSKAKLSVSGPVFIGDNDTGTVNIEGGAIAHASGRVTVGEGSDGAMTISGAGSEFFMGSLRVSYGSPNATVEVSSGGELTTLYVTLGAESLSGRSRTAMA